MLPTLEQLQRLIHDALGRLEGEGYDVAGLEDELVRTPAGYDALLAFAERLPGLPLRDDWPYVEPVAWDQVNDACDPGRPTGRIGAVDPDDAAARIRAGWEGSVVGCQLGKRLETQPSYAELKAAFSAVGQWPIDDYVTEEALAALGRRHPTGPLRGEVGPAHADDDQNYTVLGLINLERHGPGFTHAQLRDLWEHQLPIRTTWGPERRGLAAGAVAAACPPEDQRHPLHDLFVYGDLWCGAQIRADAYGYACPGNPQRAAELAFREATLNHRKTGAYATAWTAAALAAAFVIDDPLDLFRLANQFVPQRSRFGEAMREALSMVEAAADWEAGYDAIHERFGQYGHCLVFQESATLINTARFAASVGHGVCLQVMQGNDTDSYAATAGAILGVMLGPGHLENRWLAPFGDRIDLGLAGERETNLRALGDRLAALPDIICRKPTDG
jgi:hypothetical protein